MRVKLIRKKQPQLAVGQYGYIDQPGQYDGALIVKIYSHDPADNKYVCVAKPAVSWTNPSFNIRPLAHGSRITLISGTTSIQVEEGTPTVQSIKPGTYGILKDKGSEYDGQIIGKEYDGRTFLVANPSKSWDRFVTLNIEPLAKGDSFTVEVE